MDQIIELEGTKRELKKFLDVEKLIYKGNPNYVAFLRMDQLKMLQGVNNPLFSFGPHTFFMAYREGKAVGRILCGIDGKLNGIYGYKKAWFALFECIDDQNTADALFNAAENWAKKQGMDTIIGPVSPTNGDDSKGVLINDFNNPPTVLNAYNPEYYVRLYENHGFEKDEDHLAYILPFEAITFEEKRRAVEVIKKRYKIHVERLDKKNFERDCRDIHKVLIDGMPDQWEYTTPPDVQAVIEEFNALKGLYNGKFVFIARTETEEPVGFVVGVPDFNQVLIKMKGRIFPFGWFYFLKGRKKIDGMRIFVQFVSRDYQNKGITGMLYLALWDDFCEQNMRYGEASTIGEYNPPSLVSVENLGARHYRSYRVYNRALTQGASDIS